MTIKLAVLVVFGLLTGCTATYVTNEAVESNKGVEAGANAILVTNILRARDGLTPYYSDISHLRGSLQAQATVSAAAAFGAYDVTHWTGRDLANPGASVQVNPSFDIAPLNTSDFTKGINEPIDIRVFQYYLDRAIPPYLLLQLFVDKIEDVSYDGRRAVIRAYYNLPCDDSSPNCGLINKETGERYFDAKIMSWIHPYLFLHAYKLLTPYGPPITIASSGNEEPKLKDFPGVANANLLLRPVGDGTGAYRFYMASDSIAFCVAADRATKPRQGALAVTVKNQDGSIEATQSYQVIRIARNTVGSSAATTSESVDPSACIKKEVFADLGVSSQKTDSYTSIHFRSVDGMVEFLGRM